MDCAKRAFNGSGCETLDNDVEDHPFDYRNFEGTIPRGEYGGGTVMIWEEGTYEPAESDPKNKKGREKQLLAELKSGKLKFMLHGKKVNGLFALVKVHVRQQNAWLLMKLEDSYATKEDITLKDRSVITDRNMEEIAVEAVHDSVLKKMGKSVSTSSEKNTLTNSQVVTTVVLSFQCFSDNQASACKYLADHYVFTMPDKSSFNGTSSGRILDRLTNLMADLLVHLGMVFKELNLQSAYLIDSFPVSVCKNIRICKSKIIKGKELRGYNTPKHEFFYSFKIHVAITKEDIPVEFIATVGSIHGNTAFQEMLLNLPKNSDLCAYLNEEQMELLLALKKLKASRHCTKF